VNSEEAMVVDAQLCMHELALKKTASNLSMKKRYSWTKFSGNLERTLLYRPSLNQKSPRTIVKVISTRADQVQS
jgi:hypothetical protein